MASKDDNTSNTKKTDDSAGTDLIGDGADSIGSDIQNQEDENDGEGYYVEEREEKKYDLKGRALKALVSSLTEPWQNNFVLNFQKCS